MLAVFTTIKCTHSLREPSGRITEVIKKYQFFTQIIINYKFL